MLQYKTLPFELKAAGAADGLAENEFAGYASVFGVVDDYGDIVQRGAFTGTLDFFLASGLICWQHRLATPIGKPIEAYEDQKGLFIRARVSDTAQGRDCLTLMRDGVVRKLSIGFETEGYQALSEEQARTLLGDAAYDAAVKALPWWVDGLRLLTQIKLYEVSPVSFPANDAADITGVKAAGRLPETEREFERFLRDAGFPRKAAVALTNHGFAGLQRDAGQGDEFASLAASLQKAAAALKAS